MRAIIPFFGSRVAPNILYTDQALIVQLYSDEVISRKIIQTGGYTDSEWLNIINIYDIDILICGGIDISFMKDITARNVKVINNAAGEIEEILDHLIHGRLKSGYGIIYSIHDNKENIPDLPRQILSSTGEFDEPDSIDAANNTKDVNCLSCSERSCLDNENCPLCPLDAIAGKGNGQIKKMMEVALDVASEPERILCRVSELVYFCFGMHYKHIGIAFCTEMWNEADYIAELLKRYFRVTPVCCQVGRTKKEDSAEKFSAKHPGCNPLSIANTLNIAKPDLNISLGLCMGCDIIFNKKSEAPVTTLFVKDRLLANNPIGAVYSKYALEHLETEF